MRTASALSRQAQRIFTRQLKRYGLELDVERRRVRHLCSSAGSTLACRASVSSASQSPLSHTHAAVLHAGWQKRSPPSGAQDGGQMAGGGGGGFGALRGGGGGGGGQVSDVGPTSHSSKRRTPGM